MPNSRFVDRCDICRQPRHCRGYKNMVLCEECIDGSKKSVEPQKIKARQETKELTIFNFLDEVLDE